MKISQHFVQSLLGIEYNLSILSLPLDRSARFFCLKLIKYKVSVHVYGGQMRYFFTFFFQEKCGEPIFLLTKAIHYLVSSGPCDDIAHKSLNSLNESTLLGAEISYNRKVKIVVCKSRISNRFELRILDWV